MGEINYGKANLTTGRINLLSPLFTNYFVTERLVGEIVVLWFLSLVHKAIHLIVKIILKVFNLLIM